MKRTARLVLAVVMVLGVGWVAGASSVNMTGLWDLEVQSEAGSGSPSFDLKQDGDTLTGTYEGAFGESPVTGTVNGNTFQLKFNSSGIEITYDGTVEGDTIKGTLDMGSYGKGTFTGERA